MLALPERYCVTTKSSIESANATAALAMIAGTSSGSTTRRSWSRGGAPRSAAASSYSGPIDASRPRTITTTYESVNVTCPIACAGVPRPIPGKTRRKSSSSATPITISGVTSGSSMTVFTVPPPGPAPALQPEREGDTERRRDRDADDGQEERVLQRALERGIVEDAARRAREPPWSRSPARSSASARC